MPIGGQGSGDFRESQGALRILYSVVKDSIGVLASDAFTQLNPNVETLPAAVSTTLPANVKRGVLGGSVAFTRPDQGSNVIGGAVVLAGPVYIQDVRPLGMFINDSLGNANENTPGVASGKGPVLRCGGSAGDKIYETDIQSVLGGGVVGNPLPAYVSGQFLYASVNGYLSNRWQDSYEAQWITALGLGSGVAGAAIEPDVTRMGVVIAPPDATSTELFFELRV